MYWIEICEKVSIGLWTLLKDIGRYLNAYKALSGSGVDGASSACHNHASLETCPMSPLNTQIYSYDTSTCIPIAIEFLNLCQKRKKINK